MPGSANVVCVGLVLALAVERYAACERASRTSWEAVSTRADVRAGVYRSGPVVCSQLSRAPLRVRLTAFALLALGSGWAVALADVVSVLSSREPATRTFPLGHLLVDLTVGPLLLVLWTKGSALLLRRATSRAFLLGCLSVVPAGLVVAVLASQPHECGYRTSDTTSARVLRSVAETWRAEHSAESPSGECPTAERLLYDHAIDPASKLTDSFDSPFLIACVDDETYVMTAGRDRVLGTADDLVVPTIQPSPAPDPPDPGVWSWPR
jgi:hypothetical protein